MLIPIIITTSKLEDLVRDILMVQSMPTRIANERKFPNWEELPDKG
jgi:hypothetical protein